jgi:GNAT superfamily N-acetyltransferase
MADGERLSTSALVEVSVVDPGHRDAQHCLAEYFAELDRRFPGGFDVAQSLHADAGDFRPPSGAFVVARLHGEAVGCGAVHFEADEPAYLKRMWVSPAVRGAGVGARLLAELEAIASRHGDDAVRLETNGSLTEAVAMYRARGYVEVEPFNEEPYGDHWFVKQLDG